MTTFAADYGSAETALDALSVEIQSAIDSVTAEGWSADKNLRIQILTQALVNVGDARHELGDGSTAAGPTERTLNKLTTLGI